MVEALDSLMGCDLENIYAKIQHRYKAWLENCPLLF
jgi:exopolysaccharide biosynthesis predicted pyruvyltransferase EpsI